MKRRRLYRDPAVVAWALYDCGNSAFATSVMVGFFPIFLNTYWNDGASGARVTTRLMTAHGIASLIVALGAPLLGAIADRGGWRKWFLAMFAVTGGVATALLAAVPAGAWLPAVCAFAAATVGFAGANVFYDAMLTDIVEPKSYDRVSAFGYALGYIGGGLLLAVHLLMVTYPSHFLLADVSSAVRVAFLTVSVWWLGFTVPLLIRVRETHRREPQRLGAVVRQGLAQFRDTFRRARRLKPVILFLVAYWLYIDGVNTVMKVAIDYGYKLGIDRENLMLALLIVQFISFPAALLFGWLGDSIGPKRGILAGLSVYVVVTTWAAFMNSIWEFYCLTVAVGLVQGGVFSLSRSYYARLVPPGESAEFFGFYNMIGKFAAVIGPLLVATAAGMTGSTRAAVPVILPLLVIGGLLLLCGPTTQSPEHATLTVNNDG